MNLRMGAWPWAARTQHDHARMLLSRDGPGDRARATEILSEARATAERLGMTALTGQVAGILGELGSGRVQRLAEEGRPAPPGTPGRTVFRREGEYWSVAFEGDAFRLRDTKGLRYLAVLLAAPGRELHALDLVTAVEGHGPAGPAPAREEGLRVGGAVAGEEVLDAQAREAYRRRLLDLDQELEEARAWSDPERAARAEEERDFLVRELASAVGLGGRGRRTASASERARVNVTRAIRAAMERIGEHHRELGRHLELTISTGTFCSYAPDPRLPVSWET